MVSGRSLRACRICVVGAGPSGLVAARELRKEGHAVVVLEQKGDVGGQWLYDGKVAGEDPLGRAAPPRVHSSVYASLRVMEPRETIGFTDFPFLVRKDRDGRRFPGHREILLYLLDFCERFISYVGMAAGDGDCDGGGALKWVVKSKEEESEKETEEVFDAVVIATGHYSQPRLPTIRGMEVWKRTQLHSHVYRVPDPFRDQVVVLLGVSYSGRDIAMELLDIAKEVHLSAKSLSVSPALSKLLVESLGEDGKVEFEDGGWVAADAVIYCTGYSYSLPFLDGGGLVGVEGDGDRVGPLFEHTFPPSSLPPSPSLASPEGHYKKHPVVGFPFFEAQARWIAQVLSGRRNLPSPEEMMRSAEEFYQSLRDAGVPDRWTHDIGDFEYCDRYGDYCEFPRLEEWRKELVLNTLMNADADLEGYREAIPDEELLQEAYRSPHFTQFIHEATP
ncbi:unnamed protein product [Spirodela intermedia]|uniref:Flavin-containing monooxygenase n=1 Tax=Spirodela intermedia TaxID=51605 RepID=A0A7I8I7G2_SPIIN|nr:unnamed protein product [Spirodela intermedia]CAA6653537.1 unnamed protein product [Spirodela intermedia]